MEMCDAQRTDEDPDSLWLHMTLDQAATLMGVDTPGVSLRLKEKGIPPCPGPQAGQRNRCNRCGSPGSHSGTQGLSELLSDRDDIGRTTLGASWSTPG